MGIGARAGVGERRAMGDGVVVGGVLTWPRRRRLCLCW